MGVEGRERAQFGMLEPPAQHRQQRQGLLQVWILEQGGPDRGVAVADRQLTAHWLAGEPAQHLGGPPGLGAALQQGEAPAALGGSSPLPRRCHHGGDSHAAGHGAAGLVEFAPGIGPVAQEGCLSGSKDLKRFRFRHSRHRRWGDALAHQPAQPIGGGDGCGTRQFRLRGLAWGGLQPLPAKAPQHLQEHAAEPLVLAPLPHVTPAHGTAALQAAGDGLQLGGGARRRGHQIRAPVEQAHIGQQRQSPQMAVKGVAQLGARGHAVEGIGTE